jgi:hypothetical protein
MWLGLAVPVRPWSVPLHVLRRQMNSWFLLLRLASSSLASSPGRAMRPRSAVSTPWLEHLAPGRPWSVPLHVLRKQNQLLLHLASSPAGKMPALPFEEAASSITMHSTTDLWDKGPCLKKPPLYIHQLRCSNFIFSLPSPNIQSLISNVSSTSPQKNSQRHGGHREFSLKLIAQSHTAQRRRRNKSKPARPPSNTVLGSGTMFKVTAFAVSVFKRHS